MLPLLPLAPLPFADGVSKLLQPLEIQPQNFAPTPTSPQRSHCGESRDPSSQPHKRTTGPQSVEADS
ncbi:hypothetical protein L1049_001991 [Liquidambar formosana]|uniref:Uncharacterized protein n=1 Tax=Liquidambar formosana TaxID=63359 RepID=A0AAP0NF56_LIQFO